MNNSYRSNKLHKEKCMLPSLSPDRVPWLPLFLSCIPLKSPTFFPVKFGQPSIVICQCLVSPNCPNMQLPLCLFHWLHSCQRLRDSHPKPEKNSPGRSPCSSRDVLNPPQCVRRVARSLMLPFFSGHNRTTESNKRSLINSLSENASLLRCCKKELALTVVSLVWNIY